MPTLCTISSPAGWQITHTDPEEVGGFTLLHYAAWHGSLAMARLLVEELGADINVAASKSSYKALDISPLQAAARHDKQFTCGAVSR